MPGMIKRALTIAVALLAMVGMAALAMPATGVAGKGKTAKVTVHDDFFKPQPKLTVKKNTKVKFKWNGMNLNTHNVTLEKGPKGVKKSRKACTGGKITKCNKSASGAIGIKFNPKFNKKGTYDFVCTIHPTVMQLTVKVKK
jgi:plastocyanin